MSGRIAVIALVAALSMPAGAAAQAPPSFAPLAGTAGCLPSTSPPHPEEPALDCVTARALSSAVTNRLDR